MPILELGRRSQSLLRVVEGTGWEESELVGPRFVD